MSEDVAVGESAVEEVVVRPKRRKRRKKKWRDILVVLLTLAVAGGVMAFVLSPLCRFGSVQITGNCRQSLEDICRVAQIQTPVNLFKVNSAAVESNLRKDLRIASVTVSRSWWPPRLIIDVRENAIMAYAHSEYGILSLDRNGTVIAAQKSFSSYDAPLLTGVLLSDEYVGEPAKNTLAIEAVKFLAELDSTTFDQISEVNLSNPLDVTLLMNNGIRVRLGDFSRSGEKAAHLKQMIKEIAEKNFAISQIDLKFEPPTMRVKQ